MTALDDAAERLNRMVKLALDTGEATTIENAERIFSSYRLQVCVGGRVADCPVLQAALLTAVNSGARAFLGGVTVTGASGLLRVKLPGYTYLESAVRGLGARIADQLAHGVPTVVIGDADCRDVDPLAIRATFSGWAGGVVPATDGGLDEQGAFTPAGVLAGALAISEVFQRVRGGNPMACRRKIGIDLWNPGRDWALGGEGPPLERLPSAAWLVGLGNLGQSYLWTLGLLPYEEQGAHVVLQDTDILAESNLSTSLLTTRQNLQQWKTRAMADWAEARGFKTAIVERAFTDDFKCNAQEPAVALIGVDNALARQSIELVGFHRVIEAGLGRGVQDFSGIDLHTFPSSRPAREIWSEVGGSDPEIAAPAYRAMLEKTKDRCGTVRLAGRSIGAPFVGAVAGTLVIAELIRLTMGASRYEMISCHLRDLTNRSVIRGAPWTAFNPGSIQIAA